MCKISGLNTLGLHQIRPKAHDEKLVFPLKFGGTKCHEKQKHVQITPSSLVISAFPTSVLLGPAVSSPILCLFTLDFTKTPGVRMSFVFLTWRKSLQVSWVTWSDDPPLRRCNVEIFVLEGFVHTERNSTLITKTPHWWEVPEGTKLSQRSTIWICFGVKFKQPLVVLKWAFISCG